MFRGGIGDKLGNGYEAKWLIRQLLNVISGKAEWIRFEGVPPQFRGFEFAISRDGITEWHQTKINEANGNWTINALKGKEVLSAFKSRFEANIDSRCIFVSQDPAKDFRTLTEKARLANNFSEFAEILSRDQKDKFDQLVEVWQVDDMIAYTWLERCESLTFPESEIEALVASYGDLYFSSGRSSVFPELRDYAEKRFNKILTTELVRAEIRNRDAGKLVLKDWSLDPTLHERLGSKTIDYLRTYSPFGAGGKTIPRRQSSEVAGKVGQCEGPNVILLTGIAGSGKSGVVRGLIDKLSQQDITHLAFRVDHHLQYVTPQEIGKALTGRDESPVSTLKGLEPKRLSVLIIDQVDAVSEVSGRSGAVKECVLRMVEDARHFKTVRVVLACRSFDLDSDPRLKGLKEENRVEQIEVPLLIWDDEVAPLLRNKGADTNSLSPKQKDLLCLPLNLAVFLEIGTAGRTFTSRSDLFESLITRKDRAMRHERNITWSIVEPLTALARWMSNKQSLHAPDMVLDNFPGARDLLVSEGLIVPLQDGITFFHESFFDYVYARAFVSDSLPLVQLLTSTEQHLFRRTQARQILETLRQNDRVRYFSELESLLTSESVRYHIKVAIAQWLGSLSDPTDKERDIVLQLDEANKAFHPFVRYALLSSTGWFDLLCKDRWVHRVLDGKSDERQQSVLLWFSNIAEERSTEVAKLLEAWWGYDPERGKRIFDWFGYVRRKKPAPSLVALCEKVVRSRPLGLFEDDGSYRREMLLATWAETNPTEGAKILEALFEAWFDAHPGRHPFESGEVREIDMYDLEKVAEKSPRAFITGTIEALLRSIDEINRREAIGENDSSFRYRTSSRSRYGADKFLGLFRTSLRQVAQEDPKQAQELLMKLDASKHEALLHLHLEVVAANDEALAGHLLGLLGDENLFKAGWNDAPWKSFADAVRVASPHLLPAERYQIEKLICTHQPEIDYSIRAAHEIRDNGPDAWVNRSGIISTLNRSGFEQWCVFETIGEDLLTDFGLQQLRMLRQKFPGAEIPKPYHAQAPIGGAPINPERAALMNNRHWLRAIERYNNNSEGRWERDRFQGGAWELARVLQHATKENPVRFVDLMKHIPDTAPQTYIDHILWGLSEVEGGDVSLIKEAILNAHGRPGRPHGEWIVRVFGKYPQTAEDSSFFEILAWYVENAEANEDERVDSSNMEREIVSIDDLIDRGGKLHLRGINGARGWAAEAMGAVLWQVPEMVERGWDILERRVECEPLISVRCCLMRPLVPLFNNDRMRCARLVERLVEGPLEIGGNEEQERGYLSLSPLITHEGVSLLPYLLHWVPDIGRKLLDRLLDSGNETMRMIGAWCVFGRGFQDAAYTFEADCLIEEGDVYRRLAADVAAHAITSEEFRERAEQQLIRFFDDGDGKVRKQATGVFRQIEAEEFARFIEVAQAYLTSRAFEEDSFAFFDALERATCSVQGLVILAAEKIMADIEAHGDANRRHLDLHQLQDLLKREYAASENDSELRGGLLDVIDRMLEKELYGTDEILKSHERE